MFAAQGGVRHAELAAKAGDERRFGRALGAQAVIDGRGMDAARISGVGEQQQSEAVRPARHGEAEPRRARRRSAPRGRRGSGRQAPPWPHPSLLAPGGEIAYPRRHAQGQPPIVHRPSRRRRRRGGRARPGHRRGARLPGDRFGQRGEGRSRRPRPRPHRDKRRRSDRSGRLWPPQQRLHRFATAAPIPIRPGAAAAPPAKAIPTAAPMPMPPATAGPEPASATATAAPVPIRPGAAGAAASAATATAARAPIRPAAAGAAPGASEKVSFRERFGFPSAGNLLTLGVAGAWAPAFGEREESPMKPTRKLSRRSFLATVAGTVAAAGAIGVIAADPAEAFQSDSDSGPNADPPGGGGGAVPAAPTPIPAVIPIPPATAAAAAASAARAAPTPIPAVIPIPPATAAASAAASAARAAPTPIPAAMRIRPATAAASAAAAAAAPIRTAAVTPTRRAAAAAASSAEAVEFGDDQGRASRAPTAASRSAAIESVPSSPGSGYLRPEAQLNSTARSLGAIRPSATARRQAASVAAPSGQSSRPSVRAASSRGGENLRLRTPHARSRRSRAARRGSGNRRSPWARGCRRRRSRHSPTARHGRRPPARRGRSARSLRPGPRPCAAASRPIRPSASSSAKPFHIPIRPVPPPVG